MTPATPSASARGEPQEPEPADALSAIVRQSDSALLVIDADGMVYFANQAACQLLGRESLAGMAFGYPLAPQAATDIEVLRPDGSVAIVELRSRRISWQRSEAILATLNDVTERKRNEQLLIEAQQFLRSSLDALAAQIAVIDAEGTIIVVNAVWQEFARNAGYDPYASGVGHNYLAICERSAAAGEPLAGVALEGVRAVLERRAPQFDLEYPCSTPTGVVWYALRATAFHQGERSYAVIAFEEVSARKRAEHRTISQSRVLEQIARSAPLEEVLGGIFALVAAEQPDLRWASLLLRSGERFQVGDDPPAPAEWPRPGPDQEGGAPADQWVTVISSARGGALWELPVRNGRRQLVALLRLGHARPRQPATTSDPLIALVHQLAAIAVEQHQRSSQLAYQAHHDSLTALPNRALFEDRLGQAIEAASRSGQRVGVLFIDLDRFKHINDTLGHAAGDALLIRLARRLEECIRSSDTLARRGGDEFMIVLPEIGGSGQVLKVVRRIQEQLATPFIIEGHELFIGASIGASMYPDDGQSSDELQRAADSAMYSAKATLPNSFQFFNPGANTRALERLRMEGQLRRAIDRGELELYYQPKIDRIGALVGVEALVRWNHPELGLVLPGQFIPMAEELGLIVGMGEWCFGEVTRQIRAWQARGLALVPVAMNVSGVQFAQRDFLAKLRAVLAVSGLDPGCLELELTESMLMGDLDQLRATLAELSGMGVSLAIDDFGTGYSSLSYLQLLPIDVLKIDRSFVSRIGHAADDDARAIVAGIVRLGHQLRKQLVAEGVETAEQHRFLAAVGCDLFQGYHFARPMPAASFAELLASAAGA